MILVSEREQHEDSEPLLFEQRDRSLITRWSGGCPPDVYDWICPNFSDYDFCAQTCRNLVSGIRERADDWRPFGHRVKYCLSEPATQLCRVNFNIYIAIVALVCNAIKASALAYTAFWPPDEPLLVLGDALQSFTTKPDPFSTGSCLALANDVRLSRTWRPWRGPRRYSMLRKRWGAAISRRRWVSTIVL